VNSKKLPWTIKFTIGVDAFFIILCLCCSFLAAYLAFNVQLPGLLTKAQEQGVPLNFAAISGMYVASVFMWLFLALIWYRCLRSLIKPQRFTKALQIFMSVIFLAYFPLGTILCGIVLYLFLFDQKTKEYLVKGVGYV